MFSVEERDAVRERIVEMARADPRVLAGAITGSRARSAEDRWSDVDLAFGLADGVALEPFLDEWAGVLRREWGVVHHWDLRSGPSIYRVFLLAMGLQVDIAVTPHERFGPTGPTFHLLFGTTGSSEPLPRPDSHYRVGLGWHHVLHARACIERGKGWQAEHWISALRDEVITLASLRLGEEAWYARGAHRLPPSVTEPLLEALVRSLDEGELRRALAAATGSFLAEVELLDPQLSAGLRPVLREFGSPQASDMDAR